MEGVASLRAVMARAAAAPPAPVVARLASVLLACCARETRSEAARQRRAQAEAGAARACHRCVSQRLTSFVLSGRAPYVPAKQHRRGTCRLFGFSLHRGGELPACSPAARSRLLDLRYRAELQES